MTPPKTFFVDHKPNTYKAYKTIGGWGITFLDKEGNSRNADGGKIYPKRQNAYAAVKRLNHPIQHAMKKADMVEAYYDGYELVVRKDCGDDMSDVFTLSISVGAMPPHFQRDFKTLEALEENLLNDSPRFLYLNWRKAKGE